MSAILEFHDVSFAEQPPYECGLNVVSFLLAPSDLLLVRAPEGRPLTPLADAASGLLNLAAGEIIFDNKPWSARSAGEAASSRGLIGRVFERSDWLSNLDVDENITLAQRYHMRRDPAEALEEARALAREVGVGEIPPGRPARVERITLLKLQWVRALMGRPKLLLLERPISDLSSADAAAFVAALNRRRERDGVGVLWITDSHEMTDDSALRPTRKCAMEEGAMREIGQP